MRFDNKKVLDLLRKTERENVGLSNIRDRKNEDVKNYCQKGKNKIY